jgi:heme/copper-type cytochrome/quinol oxidase subunit 1
MVKSVLLWGIAPWIVGYCVVIGLVLIKGGHSRSPVTDVVLHNTYFVLARLHRIALTVGAFLVAGLVATFIARSVG